MAMAIAMATTTSSLSSALSSQARPSLRITSAAARTLSSSSSSGFAGLSLAPRVNLGWVFTERSSVVKVRAGKAALACTKRSRSRLSRARTSGFRARLQTPGGRKVLKRRRLKGRKILCPCSNPNSGRRA